MRGLPVLIPVLLLACGGRPAPLDREGDGGADAVDGPLAADGGASLRDFCSGPPRLQVNGVLSAATTEGRALWPNLYCESANVAFVGDGAPRRVVLNWQAPPSADPVAPFKLDLDDLPAGWTVRLFVGCSPSEEGCTPDEVIDSGFTGSLHVEGEMLDYFVTVCLDFVEEPSAPRRVLHSARLWAAGVHAPYPFD